MDKKVISYWDKNLVSMVEVIMEGKCPNQEIPRHCRDFLVQYRRVLGQELLK